VLVIVLFWWIFILAAAALVTIYLAYAVGVVMLSVVIFVVGALVGAIRRRAH
jgi:hypothetical protein